MLAPVVRESRDRRRAEEAAREQQRRAAAQAADARRRFFRWVLGLGAAAVVAVLLGVFIFIQLQRTHEALRQAEEQKRLALAGLLAAKSDQNRERHPPLALLLGVEAVRASPVPTALEALHDAVQATAGEPLAGHEGGVYSVAWDPHGGRLASAGSDRTVRVWDLSRPNAEPQVLRGHEGWVTSVAWDPHGGRLASAGSDGTVRVWDIAPQRLIPIACRRAGRNLTWEEHERYLESSMPLRTCEQRPIHRSAIEEAERLAGQDHIEHAVTLLKRAKEEQPDLALDPETHVRRVALRHRIEQSVDKFDRDPAQVFADLKKLLTEDPDLKLAPDVWAKLCELGAIWGRVDDAMGACAKALAVETHGDNLLMALFGRGLASAQQGNLNTAITDLERVHANLVKEEHEPEVRTLLARWIEAMKAGRSPIDAAALENLRKLIQQGPPRGLQRQDAPIGLGGAGSFH